MEDKYIVYFISKIKVSMIKFIENKFSKNGLGELIFIYGNILIVFYENNGIFIMKEIVVKIGKDKFIVIVLVNKFINLGYLER